MKIMHVLPKRHINTSDNIAIRYNTGTVTDTCFFWFMINCRSNPDVSQWKVWDPLSKWALDTNVSP